MIKITFMIKVSQQKYSSLFKVYFFINGYIEKNEININY